MADLKSLRADTHKFESHYIDNLVGNNCITIYLVSFCCSSLEFFPHHGCYLYNAGNENAYFERSPINFVDKFSCPIILFQGLEDKVWMKLTFHISVFSLFTLILSLPSLFPDFWIINYFLVVNSLTISLITLLAMISDTESCNFTGCPPQSSTQNLPCIEG